MSPDLPSIDLPHPIRLIVADIDGCLSGGTASHFDHRLLERIAEMNQMSRHDATVPAITYCTGRPQPYVECLMQTTHVYQPALCEGGTVFFDLPSHSILMHPDFTPVEEKVLAELHAEVQRRLVGPLIKPEPGKITHITLIFQRPHVPEDLLDEAIEIAAQFGDTFVVEKSRTCIHILFRHIHKGVGLQWLADHTGIATNEMAGIGDAAPDLPFLKMVGFAFAPENAHATVKDNCHYTSKLTDSESAHEMLDMILQHNQLISLTSLNEER